MAASTTATDTAAPRWRDRPDRTPVPMAQWGRDHWSLLAYLETRDVDHGGQIGWEHLTLSAAHWPALYAARRGPLDLHSADAAQAYPLRIKDENGEDSIAEGHCEGDALADLVDHGLVAVDMPAPSADGTAFVRPGGRPLPDAGPLPGLLTGYAEATLAAFARYRLTADGRRLAAQLRAHLAAGQSTSTFTPKLTASQRMLQRLRVEGVTVPSGAGIRRTYAGAAQRNLGAWSWTVTDGEGLPVRRLDDGRPYAIGSQWPLSFLLRLPHWLIAADAAGDVSIDPPNEALLAAGAAR